MSVATYTPWHRPGCGQGCSPRWHDPEAHEQHGAYLERERQKSQVVRTGPLVIDLERAVVTVGGREVVLGRSEWAILAHLAAQPGRFCPTAEVERAVWAGGHVSGNTVRTTATRLRARLGPEARRLIVAGTQSRGGLRLLLVEPES